MKRLLSLTVALVLLCLGDALALTRLNFTIATLWNSSLIVDHAPIEVALSSSAAGNEIIIDIDAPFFNDPAPPGNPPGPFDGLWNYEVVEVFLLAASTNHYIELEFSPHGHYIVLLLTGRRQVLKQLLPLPHYQAQRLPTNRWTGQAHIPRAHLPGRIDRLNAYAIHGQDQNRTYEALYPAPPNSDKPDFHRLELFQPLDFTLLLNQTDEDGESWRNQASQATQLASVLLVHLLLVAKCRP